MFEELNNTDWGSIFAEPKDDISFGNCSSEVEGLSNCDNSPVYREDVEKIFVMGDDGMDETNFAGLFLMKDSRYLAATGGHDYTGWDWQASNSLVVANTLEEVCGLGLGNSDRKILVDVMIEEIPLKDLSVVADWLKDQQKEEEADLLRLLIMCGLPKFDK